MRSLYYLFCTLAVMGLAYWAYHENYQTQRALKQVDQLQSDIGQTREALGVLRAEWAYLNRPERIRDLADLNFDRLGLLPLTPEHFGEVDQVAYPVPVALDLNQPIDVIGEQETARTTPEPKASQ